ncbi:TIGR03617 family F420-dependent LLM class oxidoreductase [Georgenia sp. AZ-5]|uniref:TIGR03617 family F420-dependent LLM class oxidoreductase n=1 Tax=Georgenia sp. AZ-5 TaxID=3367526 RepID=UPI003754964E
MDVQLPVEGSATGSRTGLGNVFKLDYGLGRSLKDAGEIAAEAEQDCYSGVWSSESIHDPFLPLLLAAGATSRVELGTSIAVALVRNPLVLATTARDLQEYSQGRFILGLGTQTKAHITRRFGEEWSRPVARMREFVSAMRAVWHCWDSGERLNFEGDFYSHTLMTPAFNPGPSTFGPPKVFLAAVGERMTQAAGEVADGLLCHSFLTPAYFRDVLLPALHRGLESSGRSIDDFEVGIHPHIVTGSTEEELAERIATVKYEIAFHASTPAYRAVLDHHGWGDLQPELNAMTKHGRWDELAGLIDDEVLRTFAVVARLHEVEAEVRRRYGDEVTRMSWRFASDSTTTKR